MVAAAFRIWLADLRSRLTSRLWSYGMFGAAGFLFLCAAGYALDALHGWLALSYGRTSASLIIAALLMVAAGGCALSASLIGKGGRHPALTGEMVLANLRPSRSTKRNLAGAGVLSAGLVALGLIGRYWRR